MVKQLKPFPPKAPAPPPPSGPRCVATVQTYSEHERRWRLQRYGEETFQCTREAVVEVQGKCYCRLHAGHLVLDMYIRGDLKEAS